MRTAVVIPALDEEGSLPDVLDAIPDHCQVVVADNGSTDCTTEVARARGARVVLEPHKGYGSAVLAGLNALQDDPPDIVVILDADGADPAQAIDTLTGPIIADRADLVLSDRTRTAAPGALTRTQRIGNQFAVHLMGRRTGHAYRDMGPFRAIRWSALQRLAMCDPTWGWNVEMQIKAVHHGLRVVEIPLPYKARTHGRSKISGTLLGVARAGSRILWAVHRYS